MSTDVKLSEAQLTKIIQLSGFLGNMTGMLVRNALITLLFLLLKVLWRKLVSNVASNTASNAINKVEIELSRK